MLRRDFGKLPCQLDPHLYRRIVNQLDEDYAKVLRTKTPTERIAMGLEANRFVRLRLEGHLRTVHPDWSDQQIAGEIARRILYGTD